MNEKKSWYGESIRKEYSLKKKQIKKNWIRVSDMRELKEIIFNSFVKDHSPESTLKTLAIVIDEKLTRNLKKGV